MRRGLWVLLGGVAGLVAGAVAMLAFQAPPVELPAESPPAPASADDDAQSGRLPPDVETRGADDGVVLVWASGGLPDGLTDAVAALPGVEDVAVVAGDRLDLVASRRSDGKPVDVVEDGWAIPLDALAIYPAGYAAFLPVADRDVVEGLQPGRVLLGATSAELRGLGAGDRLTVGPDRELVVHAVVDDELVGAAEVVVARADAAMLGIDTDRFLLVRYTGERAALEAAVRWLSNVEVRVRGPGETPYLRHGDAVLPQALIKREFGEFAYQPPAPGEVAFEQDPAWQATNLTAVDLPVLGTARCHRGIVKQLAAALNELVERGLAHLVDPDQFAGCHDARLIAPAGSLSRHAWGIAADLNVDDNPAGQASAQDPRLVDSFTRWGFTWGGFWLVPDPMHVEYVGPPDAPAAKAVDADG